MDETKRMQDKTKHLNPAETERLNLSDGIRGLAALSPGDLIAEKYEIKGVPGTSGGEAHVYNCVDINVRDTEMALKVYHVNFVPHIEILEKLQAINHEDIINVLDFGTWNHHFFEVMEYAAGGTLAQRMEERVFTEEELTQSVIPEVLNGLNFCHETGIIHRDLKPSNLFYRRPDRTDIVIGDFGISSAVTAGISVRKTAGHRTSEYTAPEVYSGHVGKEVDFYALGMTLIHLFTGVNPFLGKSEDQIMFMHLSEKITLPDDLSSRFKQLLSGLLVKERKMRWGAIEIGRWLNEEHVPVYQDQLYNLPPYKFSNTLTASSPQELAEVIQKHRESNYDVFVKHLLRGYIKDWVSRFDQALAMSIEDVVEHVRESSKALFEVIYILDPARPYCLKPELEAYTLEELALQIDSDWEVGKCHLYEGWLQIWLKRKGCKDIIDKWDAVRSQYTGSEDRGLEYFLHLLNPGLPSPQIIFEPAEITLDKVINTEVRSILIKTIHKGPRGYLAGTVSLSNPIEGVKLLKDDIQLDAVNIVLWSGESVEFKIVVDASLMEVSKVYRFHLAATTNGGNDCELPVSFSIDYPAYSKKRSNKPLTVIGGKQIFTLKELAEYCYKEFEENRDIRNIPLTLQDMANWYGKSPEVLSHEEEMTERMSSETINWIKDNLGEHKVARDVDSIFHANIGVSEKCYLFFKLTGVIEQGRLFSLFHSMRIPELETEKTKKIEETRREFQEEVEQRNFEQANKMFTMELPTKLRNWIITIILFFIILFFAFDNYISDDMAGLWLVIFLGGLVAFGLMSWIWFKNSCLRSRIKSLPPFDSFPELDARIKTIKVAMQSRIGAVDEEFVNIMSGVSVTKPLVVSSTRSYSPKRSMDERLPVAKWGFGSLAIVVVLFLFAFLFKAPHGVLDDEIELSTIRVPAGAIKYRESRDGSLYHYGGAGRSYDEIIVAGMWHKWNDAADAYKQGNYGGSAANLTYFIRGFETSLRTGLPDGSWAGQLEKKEREGILAFAYLYRGISHGNYGAYNGNKSALDAAIQDFNKFFEIAPGAQSVQDSKAYYLSPTGGGNVAVVIVAFVYELRGKIFFEKGQYESAISDFNKSIALIQPLLSSLGSNNGIYFLQDIYKERGKAFKKLGKKYEADMDFKKASELNSQGENHSPKEVK